MQPPMKCAVSGRLKGSPMVPPAVPPISSAIRRAASLPAGIQVGLGSPWPCLDESTHRPARLRRRNVVIELSRLCMTRAMTVRSDQCRTSYRSSTRPFSRHSSRSQVRQRGLSSSSSVSTVCSSDMALLPLPYRTGSMWVCASGWNEEVMATPCV